MSEEIKKTVEDTLDDLFGESKSAIEQVVELPSRGIGYPPGMDKVTIRTLTFEDEKIMSESNPDQDIVSLLLTRCVSNLDPDILYGPDKLYLLYKYTDPKVISQAIKRLTSRDTRAILEALFIEDFGIEAEAKYICSRCRQENIIEVPISEAFFTVS